MSDESFNQKSKVEVVYVAPAADISSGEEQPMSEWTSLEEQRMEENPKKILYAQGLYSPGSSDICNKYIAMSDSSVLRHHYYNYPAVLDPGIEKALLAPSSTIIYPDDGQKLYLDLCSQMDICPVRLFHRSLFQSSINLSYYGVNPIGVHAMALALQNNKTVTSFNLTDNFLTDDSCYHLGEMLRHNSTLQELTLTGCRIGESGMLRLGDKLYLNHSLSILNLARNQLGDSGGVVFAHMLPHRLHVTKVDLRKNELARETCMALAENLEYSNPFTHLDLSWNKLSYHCPSVVKMLNALSQSTVLVELNLSYNVLDGRIALALKNILKVPTLQVLDVSNNRLREEACTDIVNDLIYAKKLKIFNISYNPLTPEDAYYTLSKMLRPRVKLQSLFMEGVCVNPPFLELLKRVMNMKARKNFVVTFGEVLQNWTLFGPNIQELVLKRTAYLGATAKKKADRVDMALYFLELNKKLSRPIAVKDLIDRVAYDKVPLTDNLLEQLAIAFPGPKRDKAGLSVNFETVCEYIRRLWPNKKLPLTPPPEPEPEPELVVEQPPKKKGKGKK